MNKLISINPANEKIINQYTEDTEEKIQKIIINSSIAQSEWKERTVNDRIQVLSNIKEDLENNINLYSELITLEMGKPINESISEIKKCISLCEYYFINSPQFLKSERIDLDTNKSRIIFEPLGIILGIMPWNFPFWQVFRFAIPALIAGNTVLLKHASNVQGTSILINKIFNRTITNIFNSLIINSESVSQIISNKHIKAISFTGSDIAGSKVAECSGRNIKKTVLELGGSDPFIVLEDADLDRCLDNAVISRMINNGQSCIAAKRFIVHEKIFDKFIDGLKKRINKLIIGNPIDSNVDVGPLATKNILLDLDSQIQQAINLGASLISGGFRINKRGYFYAPTIIANLSTEMSIYYEETFGPIFSIIKAKDIRHMIDIANDSDFGLSGSVWSKNKDSALSIAKKIESGCVFINDFTKSDPRLPFGGIKKSGYGKELSQYGIKEFVNIKTIISY